ncbi:hypothetical protein ACFQ7O_23835 [Streptomyces sp. NPDC056485]|uniref:hypothetical protein n=1 Tax=Streptomyces sp. NPDC056485 TaxID=3345834 RepID=UPI0036C74B01
MYVLKLVTADDVPALNGLLALRMDWLDQNGLPLSGEASSLMDLVRLPRPGTVPIGMWDGAKLIAALAVQSAGPIFGWTLDEQKEPSLVLSLAHTLPQEPKLSATFVSGLCHYAARLPYPPTWIRCTARANALARYLEEDCGWIKVREIGRPYGDAYHLLQRPRSWRNTPRASPC